MKRNALALVMAMSALMVMADSKQTVTVNGTVAGDFATHITFAGDQLNLTFADGTTLSAPIDATDIALTYTATLSDAAGQANVETIRTFGLRTMAVEVTRELKAGMWTTICLPFAMTDADITATFGQGTKVARLQDAEGSSLNFVTTTAMEADMPYLVCPAFGLSSFALPEATLSSYAEGATVITGGCRLTGIYTTTSPATAAYTLSTDGGVSAIAPGSEVSALQAFVTLDGGTTAPTTFTVDGTTVGIHATPSSITALPVKVYNLHGQLMGTASQLPRGVYIAGGKKLVINH